MQILGKHTFSHFKAFTLVELIISILISVILLGGIFYFLSETILGIATATAHAKFLKEFYNFTSIFETGDFAIIQNSGMGSGYDIGMLTSIDNTSGLLVGVVDNTSKKLIPPTQYNIYTQSNIAYRPLSQNEIVAIGASGSIVYNMIFQNDTIFQNFFIRDFQLTEFNTGATNKITEMYLNIYPVFRPELEGENWINISKEDLFEYTLVF